MLKHSFVVVVTYAALLGSTVHAQEEKDPGQLAGQGVGFALTTQERCTGHPVRSPEAERLFQTRLVTAISKHTGSTIDAVRLGLAAGAMQANFTKKPSKKDCHEAEKILSMAQKL